MGLLLGSGNTKPQYPYDQWYGVQGDFTSQDKKLKRVGNLDLHRTLPIQSKLRRFVENEDGSVKYYLHQNDSRKKIQVLLQLLIVRMVMLCLKSLCTMEE